MYASEILSIPQWSSMSFLCLCLMVVPHTQREILTVSQWSLMSFQCIALMAVAHMLQRYSRSLNGLRSISVLVASGSSSYAPGDTLDLSMDSAAFQCRLLIAVAHTQRETLTVSQRNPQCFQ